MFALLFLVFPGFLYPCPLDGVIGVDERYCSSLGKVVGSCPEGGPEDTSTMVDGTPMCH